VPHNHFFRLAGIPRGLFPFPHLRNADDGDWHTKMFALKQLG
jgi:hypothetical protein